jgi:hypothetical protein
MTCSFHWGSLTIALIRGGGKRNRAPDVSASERLRVPEPIDSFSAC